MGVMREAPETQNWVGFGSSSGSGIAELVKGLPKWLMNMSTDMGAGAGLGMGNYRILSILSGIIRVCSPEMINEHINREMGEVN